MKILVIVEITTEKNSCRVWKAFDVSSPPIHKSVICITEGPNRRLNDDISIEVRGLSFRFDAHKAIHNLSSDHHLIEIVDEVSFESNKTLKQIEKEYLDSKWERIQ